VSAPAAGAPSDLGEMLGAIVRHKHLVAAIRAHLRRRSTDAVITRGQLIAYYGRKHPDIADSTVPLAVDEVLRRFWR
jgi:DNA-binding response OmpR family regulator